MATSAALVRTKSAGISEAEWEARVELAACYRLFNQFGWHELIYNHITVRVPGTTDQFLINPFGLMYREVKASNLVKMDIRGNKLDDSPYDVNPAGFVVHSAVHAGRHDVHCVMHTHTTAGQAVSCQEEGLLPLSFNAMFYTDRIAYHEFEGITLDAEECGRLAASLGNKNLMILRNHGLLACGPTVGDAFAEMYQLQRSCEVQLAAMSGGAKLHMPPHAVAQRVANQYEDASRSGSLNKRLFTAMVRWMDDIDPSFRD
jgi:ribulose-5-phosphate 4-epimerase/fuculose-1-phosphate aldolase